VNSGYALHLEAYADLDDIRNHIAQENPDPADRLMLEIFDAIRDLVPFPRQGHRRPDLSSRPLRFILVREYLIAYAPDDKPLWVVAVMHGRRNPRIMAAIFERQRIAVGTEVHPARFAEGRL
jgi:plasmid stabilization system protein ParE